MSPMRFFLSLEGGMVSAMSRAALSFSMGVAWTSFSWVCSS
jgi:hypothetical protein